MPGFRAILPDVSAVVHLELGGVTFEEFLGFHKAAAVVEVDSFEDPLGRLRVCAGEVTTVLRG